MGEKVGLRRLANMGDEVMKVSLVCRFYKQILAMRLLRLCSDALFKY